MADGSVISSSATVCTHTFAMKRTGVVEKHCSSFALYSNAFLSSTNKRIHVNRRLNEKRINRDL